MKAYSNVLSAWFLHMSWTIAKTVSVQFYHLCDLLFGVHASTLIDALPIPVMLPLPEGEYYGDLTRFTLRAGRPRLPLPTVRRGAIVRLYDGIPMPDEHGAYGMLVSLSTRELDVQAALCDVLRRIADYRAVLKEVQA